ncbi:O-antigen polymerase [Vibrio tasmaniensis]|uniref:O-antigen polymerase n=1 Tax=Vibrio tasmaniensis TaxID=212663 RepID=UPI001117C654|nr:O-antigen polymerase [Vibrio tasmaniensis]
MKYFIFNPFFILGSVLLFSISTTYLGWSELFEVVSDETLYIYIYSSVAMIVLGVFFQSKISNTLKNNHRTFFFSFLYSRNDKYLILAIYLFFFIEVVFSGYVPILYYNYEDILELDFGVPLLHGLYVSFVSYISLVFYQKRLSCKLKGIDNSYFLYVIMLNLIFVMMGRRGIIVFNVLAYLFMYLYYYVSFRRNILPLFVKLLVFVSLFLYLFNLMGNVRLGKDSNEYILTVGKASQEFRDSYVPKEFFYGYLYISSPVSIFDVNRNISETSIYDFLLDNIVPDFIARRVNNFKGVEAVDVNGFTVGGLYLKPYNHLGVLGVYGILLFFFMLSLIVLYNVIHIRKRALVSLMFFLSVTVLLSFQNILNSGGFVMQIYYSIIFVSLSNVKFGGRTILPLKKGNLC